MEDSKILRLDTVSRTLAQEMVENLMENEATDEVNAILTLASNYLMAVVLAGATPEEKENIKKLFTEALDHNITILEKGLDDDKQEDAGTDSA